MPASILADTDETFFWEQIQNAIRADLLWRAKYDLGPRPQQREPGPRYSDLLRAVAALEGEAAIQRFWRGLLDAQVKAYPTDAFAEVLDRSRKLLGMVLSEPPADPVRQALWARLTGAYDPLRALPQDL